MDFFNMNGEDLASDAESSDNGSDSDSEGSIESFENPDDVDAINGLSNEDGFAQTLSHLNTYDLEVNGEQDDSVLQDLNAKISSLEGQLRDGSIDDFQRISVQDDLDEAIREREELLGRQ